MWNWGGQKSEGTKQSGERLLMLFAESDFVFL